MNATFSKMMDAMIGAFVNARVAGEQTWLPRDRRGRWVVLEPGAGRHLRGSPAHVREIVDRATPRRARRFSSLSRARAFAREVGGTVFRWRRTPPGGGVWRRESPWERARASISATPWIPIFAKTLEQVDP